MNSLVSKGFSAGVFPISRNANKRKGKIRSLKNALSFQVDEFMVKVVTLECSNSPLLLPKHLRNSKDLEML